MVKSTAFGNLHPFSALVIGDFFLDTYTLGRVQRISPEAPVPVMEVFKQESRPGGAGNAVLNLIALGGLVFAVGRIGADADGDNLQKRLASAGVDVRALFVESGYRTPVKNRFISDSQQLLRVDFEAITSVDKVAEEAAICHLEQMIPVVQVVAISDYGKGFLSNRLIREVIRIAAEAKVPTIVDPKGSDFTKYRGATILKPNLSEAYAAVKMNRSASLDEVADEILKITEVERLLITRSEAGISLFGRQEKRSDFSVRSREVKDVTGAGDTVLAVMSLGMANGLDIPSTVQLANIAAGIAIERIGCAQVRLSEIAERLLETDFKLKIFDENHTCALQQVLKDKNYSLLVLGKEQLLTSGLFSAICSLRQEEEREWIVYVEGEHPDDALLHFLASLQDVRAIVLQKKNLKHLCDAIHPCEVLFLEGEKAILSTAKDLLVNLLAEKV